MKTSDQKPPTLSSPARIFKDYEQLERALKETEDRWLDDFSKPLGRAAEDTSDGK